jgi:hypothetical protein
MFAKYPKIRFFLFFVPPIAAGYTNKRKKTIYYKMNSPKNVPSTKKWCANSQILGIRLPLF